MSGGGGSGRKADEALMNERLKNSDKLHIDLLLRSL
jgi:hypothetical protein